MKLFDKFLEREKDVDKVYASNFNASSIMCVTFMIGLAIHSFFLVYAGTQYHAVSTGDIGTDLTEMTKLIPICAGFVVMCLMFLIFPLFFILIRIDKIEDILQKEVLKKKTIKCGALHGPSRYRMKKLLKKWNKK